MEIDGGLGRPVVERKRDEPAERVQKLFQDFLEEFQETENGEKFFKYKGTRLFQTKAFSNTIFEHNFRTQFSNTIFEHNF